MATTKKLPIKEVLKNKKFLLVAAGVAVIALIMYLMKSKQTTSEVVEPVTGSYGAGVDSGSSFVTPSTQPVVETPKVEPIIDTGKTDLIENHVDIVDKGIDQQEASNKIYDLKELYARTKEQFGTEPITKEQDLILSGIHEKAVAIAQNANLGTGGASGLYPGLKSDTRKFNAITGEPVGGASGVEAVMTDQIKTQRIEAQKQIDELGKQWNLTADKAKKEEIHQQAETIGINAGLNVGGASGSKRKQVDVKTGKIIGG